MNFIKFQQNNLDGIIHVFEIHRSGRRKNCTFLKYDFIFSL